jgi:hypothetical protein
MFLAQCNQHSPIIGLLWIIKRRFISPHSTTFLATMHNHPTFFAVLFNTYRLENPAASAGTITRKFIHMQAVQAFRAVITHTAILER